MKLGKQLMKKKVLKNKAPAKPGEVVKTYE
jgi:hypothetical protein